ncbi:MAG: FKBP-type peptidyl-prolyl cis-trans isomerase [Planctomycetota bacterium]|nr:FKBP-type peptidyl-prolyl cis-trans isomerase [Planctomycetota bacterium]
MTFRRVAILAVVFLAVQGYGCARPTRSASPEPSSLDTPKGKSSYAAGVSMARITRHQGIGVDPAVLSEGLRDAMNGRKLSMTDEDLSATLNALRAEQVRKAAQASGATPPQGNPQTGASAPAVKMPPMDKLSYALGVDAAQGFKRQGADVDVEVVARGFKDAFTGATLLMTEEEIQKARGALQLQIRVHEKFAPRVVAMDNQKKGLAFLAENKAKEGVTVLPTGLQYKVLRSGEGRKPTDADAVFVHYRGTLLDGTEVVGSPRGGAPATLKVSEAVPGLREALKLMPVGSKWQVFIPSHLAYGSAGRTPDIEPNSTLLFEVELLGIQ